MRQFWISLTVLSLALLLLCPRLASAQESQRPTTDSLKNKLAGTKWINSNKVSFEWTQDGRFLHKGIEREWKVLDGKRVQIVFAASHKDTLVFNDSFTEFKQLIKGGPGSMQGSLVVSRDRSKPAQQPRDGDIAGSQPIALDQFRAEQCQITKQDKGIRVTFRPGENPGIVVRAPQAWNWNRFGCLALELQNPGKLPVSFLVRIDDESPVPPAEMPTARGTLGPGESARFAIHLLLEGKEEMKGQPTEPGARPLALVGPAPLNLAHVVGFGIFLNRPRSAQDLIITGVRLMPPAPVEGIVDRFGQYTRADWPGKLKTVDEWRERIKAEEADLKAHPPSSERNRFGGSKTARSPNNSGFFRTAKVGGKWWLVDPDGGLFFSVGVSSLHFGHGSFVDGREKLFTWLPERSDPLSKHFRERVQSLTLRTERRAFDFYAANLERKYGSGYMPAWRESTLTRLPSWGFNTIGGWPDFGLYKNSRVPYVANIDDIVGDHGRIEGGLFGAKMHDPFDPTFPKSVAASDRGIPELARGDPWCIGYFVENEMSVGGWGNDEHREALAYGALAAPRGSHARAEFVKQLRSKYGQIAKLNAAWGTQLADWSLFDDPVKIDPAGTLARKTDCQVFVKALARKYYQTVRDALKKEDPDHLYLGSRHGTWTPEFALAAAEFCDVVTFTIFHKRLDPSNPKQATSIFNRMDKPCLITEFSMGALDRGMFHPGVGPAASDQQHRAELFKGYVASALDHPSVVGCHWYCAIDRPLTGAVLDGSNYNEGLVSVTDTPYPEMIAAARDILGRMYQRRSGRK